MNRFVILSFLVMGVSYYELSGGSDFVPETRDAADSTQVATTTLSTSNSEHAPALEAAASAFEGMIVALAGGATPAQAATLDAVPAVADSVGGAMSASSAESVLHATGPEEITFVSLVSPGEAPAADAESYETRIVDANRLNVREGPSINDGVIGQLLAGEIVTLVDDEQKAGWALVRLEGDGIEGWVSDRYLVQ